MKIIAIICLAAALLSGCATTPTDPTVASADQQLDAKNQVKVLLKTEADRVADFLNSTDGQNKTVLGMTILGNGCMIALGATGILTPADQQEIYNDLWAASVMFNSQADGNMTSESLATGLNQFAPSWNSTMQTYRTIFSPFSSVVKGLTDLLQGYPAALKNLAVCCSEQSERREDRGDEPVRGR